MIYGLWQSAAGLQAQQVRQGLLSANIANSETPGFKPDWVSFRERPIALDESDTPGDARPPHALLDRLSGGLASAPTHTDFSAGPTVPTQNALDLAVDGDGFFNVRTADGVRYTRNGRMTLREDGALVTASGGFEVLDDSGQPIRIDKSQAAKIDIDEQGVVHQGSTTLGTLKVTEFADRQELVKTGQNLFDASAARATVGGHSGVRQYAYEGSGVDPISSMVRMIEASRAYQLNATMIQIQDETLGKAVNEVGRLA